MPDTQTTTSVAWQLVPDLVYLHNLIDQYYQLLNTPNKPNELNPQDILEEINRQLKENPHNLPKHIDFPADLEGINQALSNLSQEIIATQTPTPEYSQTTTFPPEFSSPTRGDSPSQSQKHLEAYWDTAAMLARQNSWREQALELAGLNDNRSRQVALNYIRQLEKLGFHPENIPQLTADYLSAQFAPSPTPTRPTTTIQPITKIQPPTPPTIPPSLSEAESRFNQQPSLDHAQKIIDRLTAHPRIQTTATKLQQAVTQTPEKQRQIILAINQAVIDQIAPGPAPKGAIAHPPLQQAIQGELVLGGAKPEVATTIARQLTEAASYHGLAAGEPIQDMSTLAKAHKIPLEPTHATALTHPAVLQIVNQHAQATTFTSLANPEALAQAQALAPQIDTFLTQIGHSPEILPSLPVNTKIDLAINHLTGLNSSLAPELHRLLGPKLPEFSTHLIQNLRPALESGSYSFTTPPAPQGFFQRIIYFFRPSTVGSPGYGDQPFISYVRSFVAQLPQPQPSVSFLVRLKNFIANLPGNLTGFFGGGSSNTGSIINSGSLQSLGNLLGKGGSGLLEGLGGLSSKLGLGSLGSQAVGGATATAANAAAAGTAGLATTATAPAWLPTLAVIGSIGLVLFIVLSVNQQQQLAQLRPMGAGGSGEPGVYMCNPENGEDCPVVTCESDGCDWPVSCGCVLQGPFAGTHAENHLNAVDFTIRPKDGCPGDYQVVATHPGEVTYVEETLDWGQDGGSGNYGNRVVITVTDPQGKKFEILYGHLINIQVSQGQNVVPGQVIATANETGMGDEHLHFEARYLSSSVTELLPEAASIIPDYCDSFTSCGGGAPLCVQSVISN